MDTEELLKHQMRHHQQEAGPPTRQQMDKWIDWCCKERDQTLYTLGQACVFKLQQAPVVSFLEIDVLPFVINRLNERLAKGET